MPHVSSIPTRTRASLLASGAGMAGGPLVNMLSGPAGLTVVMLAAIASLGSWLAVLAATVVAGVIQLLLSVARAGWRGWTQFGPFIITIVAVLFTDLLKGVSIGLGLGFFILKDNAKAGSLELHGILSGAVAGH